MTPYGPSLYEDESRRFTHLRHPSLPNVAWCFQGSQGETYRTVDSFDESTCIQCRRLANAGGRVSRPNMDRIDQFTRLNWPLTPEDQWQIVAYVHQLEEDNDQRSSGSPESTSAAGNRS
jgi:hypothetical protein